jgi:hypothetical protein
MIKTVRICLAILFLSVVATRGWAENLVVKKDLSQEWMVYENGSFAKFDGQKVTTIYLDLNADRFAGDFLHIENATHFNLFINGKLAADGTSLLLSLDSLSKRYTAAMQICIRSDKSGGQLRTTIKSRQQHTAERLQPEKHKDSSFRDFSVVAALIMIILLITVIQVNPKLASDYFSIQKIFSPSEGEDSQVYSRMTSSTNILFYLFCSLMLGYFLMIIFQFVADRYVLAYAFQAATFGGALVLWLKLSLVILLLFFAKIILVYGLAYLFGMQAVAGVHFFNWIRLILVIFGAAAVILSIYFIARGQSETFFAALFQFFSWALAGWMIIILFKLRGRTDHSVFHLFSYICATELIPFLFIIKILYH